MAKKILVVDDSQTVRQQVAIVLQEAGYAIEEAEDGMIGAEKVKNVGDIAMVICDVNMPRMNGLEMLEKLKAEATRPGLPIVMLTTEGRPDLIDRAKAAGAKGWIVKPFKPELLLAAAKKLAGEPS